MKELTMKDLIGKRITGVEYYRNAADDETFTLVFSDGSFLDIVPFDGPELVVELKEKGRAFVQLPVYKNIEVE